MSTKSSRIINSRSNGSAKRGTTSVRLTSKSKRDSSTSANALTERAWKKTYENRSKSRRVA